MLKIVLNLMLFVLELFQIMLYNYNVFPYCDVFPAGNVVLTLITVERTGTDK